MFLKFLNSHNDGEFLNTLLYIAIYINMTNAPINTI